MGHNSEFKLETIDDYKQHLRRIEDNARILIIQHGMMLAAQKPDTETGLYAYDGEAAWKLDNEISKSRLLFDGHDEMSRKAPGKNLAINGNNDD